jgi:septin family protein
VDIEFMRRLQPYVNLIPVIAKADTMTVAERDAFRRLILAELRNAGVRIFELDAPRVSMPPPSIS